MNEMTAEQQIRLQATKLVTTFYKDAFIEGRPFTTDHIIARAAKLAAYIERDAR